MNTDDNDLILVIDPEDVDSQRIDFGELHLNRMVALAFKRALRAEVGHNLPDTQKKAFKALKLLAEYLRQRQQVHLIPLPADVATGFTEWLKVSSLGPSAQPALKMVCRLLSWCQRNLKGIVPEQASFWVSTIRDTNNPKRVAAQPDLKIILAACYRQIEAIEKRLEVGRRLISGENLRPTEEPVSELVRDLLFLGKGVLPKQRLVNRSGKSFARRIEELGGYRVLARMLWLCPEDLFPFFVAVVAQTSGNPDAIKILSRDCIHQHPLRSDLERIQWIKKRAGREQFSDFPAGRQWSAPSILRRLMTLNEPILSWCGPAYANKVFVSYCVAGRKAKGPDKKILLDELGSFIKKNELAPFQFRDLRHAGARAHHKASGSILAAKRRLNHMSVASTVRYTNLEDRADEHELLINRFQGEMVQLSIRKPSENKPRGHSEHSSPSLVDTVFGFGCKDPLAGLHPGSTKGKTCLQFAGCATCPGAMIILDNPKVVARLMATSYALEETKKRAIAEGWWLRYELLYEETRQILSMEILPAVHPSVRAVASSIDIQRLIPVLE